MYQDQIEGSRILIAFLPLKQDVNKNNCQNWPNKVDKRITSMINTNLLESGIKEERRKLHYQEV